jgi:anti-sigma factor RsiW
MTPGSDLSLQLSAYRDGELPDAEARAVADEIARNPAVRTEYDALLATDDALDAAFAAMLNDPVPARLSAAIARATPAPTAANSPFPPRLGIRVAAALVLLAVGGTGGALLNQRFGSVQVAAVGWLDDVADYHRIYAAQGRHLVEVSATETGHLETWLSEQTGVPFAVPDLSANGLTFQGARLLVAAGKPVAQLMYTDAAGQVIALCFMTGGDPAVESGRSPLTPRSFDGVDMVSWKTQDASFVAVGPQGFGNLPTVAETAADLLL